MRVRADFRRIRGQQWERCAACADIIHARDLQLKAEGYRAQNKSNSIPKPVIKAIKGSKTQGSSLPLDRLSPSLIPAV